MSRTNRKSSNQKTRRRVTRNLPAKKSGGSVKGGLSSPTSGIQVAMADGSVRMGDGSVRFVKDSISLNTW